MTESPSPAPDTCWLYLIRHGATENNRVDPPRLQGRRTDPSLSIEGHRQARCTAHFLAHIDLDAVYSSPLTRAHQTAAEIAQSQGVGVQVVDDLIEVDVGEWEGRAWDEIQRTDTDAYRMFMNDAAVHPYLGGENMQTVRDRVVPTFKELMIQNLGCRIAVVAHNVVNRVYLSGLMDVPLARYRSIPQDNCGVNLLRFRNGRTKAVTVNGIFHLQDAFI